VAELSDVPAAGAEAVFRRQVDAFNARDIEQYLATFAPDAVVHGITDGLPLRGLDELRDHYSARLADPRLHCEALEVLVWPGGWIIARERVTSSAGTTDVTAMFAIVEDAIARAFISL
jgi:hypothetical protein